MIRKCTLEDKKDWVRLNKQFIEYEYKDENVWNSPLKFGNLEEDFELILNDTVKRYGKIAIAKTKTIKVELDGKKIEIPPSCSLTLDTNLGEHTLRTYASILSKGPVKKINIGEEGAEIDIIFNSKVEQIFVDYYTYYSENKEDPVLEIINSYWEA